MQYWRIKWFNFKFYNLQTPKNSIQPINIYFAKLLTHSWIYTRHLVKRCVACTDWIMLYLALWSAVINCILDNKLKSFWWHPLVNEFIAIYSMAFWQDTHNINCYYMAFWQDTQYKLLLHGILTRYNINCYYMVFWQDTI